MKPSRTKVHFRDFMQPKKIVLLACPMSAPRLMLDPCPR